MFLIFWHIHEKWLATPALKQKIFTEQLIKATHVFSQSILLK